MKKLITFSMMLVLALALAVPCFASEEVLPMRPDDGKSLYCVLVDGRGDTVMYTYESITDRTVSSMYQVVLSSANYYKLTDGAWIFNKSIDETYFLVEYLIFESTGTYATNKLDIFGLGAVDFDDWVDILTEYQKQISVATVVDVLVLGAIVVVGLVFMWWGVRKLSRAVFTAFRKGKISV